MERYFVKGAYPIEGSLAVQGAKNAALPILAASLLCSGCQLENCPRLSDVEAACHILNHLGCKTKRQGAALLIEEGFSGEYSIPENLMREMRSSIVFLGAILAKHRRASLSLPGGCELGPRPIDLHLSSLEKMGVCFQQQGERLEGRVAEQLHGASIDLPFPSVGATENIMLAAVLAQGETVIRNAAREPEISDLADFLNKAGACISIDREGTVRICGVKKLHACVHRVIPDRIAGISYLCAAAISGGKLLINRCCPDHMRAVFPIFEEMGCKLQVGRDEVQLNAPKELKAVKSITTMPYPGFPTDALAPIMAVTTVAKGTSVFTENIFQNRYKQAWELCRMGADIRTEGRIALVRGVKKLHAASVNCTDLRGGAALIIAALAAEGMTVIEDVRHIQRGYENLPGALCSVGANITWE